MSEELNEIGKGAYACIVEMVNALQVDYSRLEELQDERDALETDAECSEWGASDDGKEYAELKEKAGECENEDEARERIQEDALSVEVRSDWYTPGDAEAAKPSEFCILLTTGGPAVRIRGELDEYAQPDRAWLEVQDWGTPWTRYFEADQDVLLAYALCFYYGEG